MCCSFVLANFSYKQESIAFDSLQLTFVTRFFSVFLKFMNLALNLDTTSIWMSDVFLLKRNFASSQAPFESHQSIEEIGLEKKKL